MRTLLLLATLFLLLPACTTPPPFTGTLATKAGQIKVYPDGRFEIVVDPRTSK